MSLEDRYDEEFWKRTYKEVVNEGMMYNESVIDAIMIFHGIQDLLSTENHLVYETLLTSNKIEPTHIFHMFRRSARSCCILKDVIDKMYNMDMDAYEAFIKRIVCRSDAFCNTMIGMSNKMVEDFFNIKKYLTNPDISAISKELLIEDMLTNNPSMIPFITYDDNILTMILVTIGGILKDDTLRFFQVLSDYQCNLRVSNGDELKYIKSNIYLFEVMRQTHKTYSSISNIDSLFIIIKIFNDIILNSKSKIISLIGRFVLQGIIDDIKAEVEDVKSKYTVNGMICIDSADRDAANPNTLFAMYIAMKESSYGITPSNLISLGMTEELQEMLDVICDFVNNTIIDLYEYFDKESAVKEIEVDYEPSSTKEFIDLIL